MVILHLDPVAFGMSHNHESVKAHYNTLEEAQSQAAHNLELGVQRPLRIVDENGSILIDYTEQP